MNNNLALNPPVVFRYYFTLKWEIILRMFWILSILSIAGLLVFCVFQLNTEVSEGYLIKKYESRLGEISKENQNLEISSFEVDSLDNIVVLLEELNFEKTEKIHYIRVLDGKVVAK